MRREEVTQDPPAGRRIKRTEWRALFTILWRQGVVRSSRFLFWHRLAGMLHHNPYGVASYLGLCGHYEHFHDYRREVRREIEAQLKVHLENYSSSGCAEEAPDEVDLLEPLVEVSSS